MARYAFISDVHGNIAALEAAWAAIERIGVEATICLGDVVGYGPYPGECLEFVGEKCAATVLGNHELAVISDIELDRFNRTARQAIEYTRERLTDGQIEQIRALPVRTELGEVTAAHANPAEDVPTDYIHDQHLAALAYGGFDNFCLFVGHTHIPVAFGTPEVGYARVEPRDVRVAFLPPGLPLRLDPSFRYILNPGSVGQPRDGNPDASFGILDTDRWTFTVHRAAYDVEATQRAIVEAKLPNFLAQRLRMGA